MVSEQMQLWLAKRDQERESVRLKIQTNTRPEQRERIFEKHFATDYSKCVGVRKLGAKTAVPVVIDSVFMVRTEFGCLTVEEVYGEVEVLSLDEMEKRCQEVQSEWTEEERERRYYLKALEWSVPAAGDSFDHKPRKKRGGE